MHPLPLFVALVAAVSVAVFTGCGAADTVDPVAQAAGVTEASGGAQVRMTGSVSVAGQALPMTGGGVIDNKSKTARLTMQVQLPKLGKTSITELLKWPVIYMQSPLFAGHLPHGAQWMKLDVQKFGQQAGIDLGSLQNSGGSASDMLRWLKASGNSKKVGTETINGVPTTHYRSTLDFKSLAKKSSDPLARQSILRLEKLTHVRSLPADVWIDHQARVRRERMGWSQTLRPDGGQRMTVQSTIDFLKFGVPVTLHEPSGTDVFDATALAGKAFNGSQPSGG